jgi:hypothetical protein
MPLSHLVVVVPGIGGSNLKTADGGLVWGHNLESTVVSAFRPEALAIDKVVVPTGLLRVFGVFPWSGVASYDRLTIQMKQLAESTTRLRAWWSFPTIFGGEWSYRRSV